MDKKGLERPDILYLKPLWIESKAASEGDFALFDRKGTKHFLPARLKPGKKPAVQEAYFEIRNSGSSPVSAGYNT